MKKGIIFIIVGFLCIGAALGIYGYNMWDSERAGEKCEKVLEEIKPAIKERIEFFESIYETEEERDTPAYIIDPTRSMPYIEVDETPYIGMISLTPLGLEFPVAGDWSYERMKDSPCRYSGSAYLDNMVIAAHNYTTHFGRIDNLRFGDRITFTDMDGNVFEYEVVELETLRSTAIYDMTNGDWDLTLFTCDLSGQSRVTVRCDRVSE